MPALLANLDPMLLGQWLQNLAWLAGGTFGVVALVQKLRGGPSMPQPFSVRAAHDVATQQDVKEVHGRIAREREEIDSRIAQADRRFERIEEQQGHVLSELRREMKEDARGIHERINQILQAVARLEGSHK